MSNKRISLQKHIKLVERKCQICDEDNYDLLDAHRITPGSEGGKYTKHNTVCLCSNCHRKVHAGLITIDGKFESTKGTVLHYFIDGEEFWR